MNRLPPNILIQAYSEGYFPMPDPDTGELLWFRPDPRAVIPLDGFKCSTSLSKCIRKKQFSVTFDTHFEDVMHACADRKETWITEEFIESYTELFRLKVGHSVEVWVEDKILVGGVYGLSLGGAFFAESKFHKKTNASKIALFYLVERLKESGFSLLEVQFLTPHLKSLGAIEISDVEYQKKLHLALRSKVSF